MAEGAAACTPIYEISQGLDESNKWRAYMKLSAVVTYFSGMREGLQFLAVKVPQETISAFTSAHETGT